jgi:hypothetical protein
MTDQSYGSRCFFSILLTENVTDQSLLKLTKAEGDREVDRQGNPKPSYPGWSSLIAPAGQGCNLKEKQKRFVDGWIVLSLRHS